MESAVAAFGSQDPIFNDDIDVDSILRGFPDDYDPDLYLWLSDSPPVDSNSPKESEAPFSISSFADELEKFLIDDDHGDQVEDGDNKYLDVECFFTDVLADGPSSGGSEVASPESGGSAQIKTAREMGDEVVVIYGEEREEEDEQIRNKRRRQMRNRESAMQSRERKKLYVKELEMKNKYLESECRRLDYALRCCMAENFALHQRLQKNGATTAKQESAVLFMESLLLGSLFWLVSIVCLFLLPSLQILKPKDGSRLGRGLALEVGGSKMALSKRVWTDFGFDLATMRRRCRGFRTRMKSFLFPLHSITAMVF